MGAVRRRVAGAARARGSPAGRMGQAPGGSQVAGACRQRVQGRVAGVRAPRGRVAGLVAGSPFPPTLRPIPTGSGLRARVARRWSRARVAVVRIASGGRCRRSRPRIARGGRGRGRGRGSRSRGSRAGPQTLASHCIARVPGHRLDPLTNPHPRSHQNPSNFTVENSSWKCTHAVQATYAVCGPRQLARGCSPRSQAGARVVY